MMKIDLDLCVGGSLDPRDVRKTIHGLRLLARLGRRAERDLAILKRDGELLRPTAWLEAGDNYTNKGLESLSIHVTNSITKPQVVSRDYVPGWKDISISFSPLGKVKVGPHNMDCFDVFLSGVVMEWNGFINKMNHHTLGEHTNRYSHSSITGLIGHVRLKKNGQISFTPDHNGWPIFTAMRGPFNISKISHKRSSNIMAECVACNLIKYHHSSDDRKRYSAILSSLRRKIPGWLVEDGTAERFVDQIKHWSSSVRVITDIMEQ